jgi:hypothetical protein
MKRYFCLTLAIGVLSVLTPNAASAQRRSGPGKNALDKREQGTLKVGQKAPNIKLTTVKDKKPIKLSSFKGKKPVVLVFGSYT